MSHLKALIFDVDGTLAETERDGHRVAFNRAFSDAGLDWHWDDDLYADLLAVTGGKERIHFYLKKFKNEAVTTELEMLVTTLHEAKTRHYTDILHSNAIALRPGVERLIEQARHAGLKLAIATTTTPANVDALLTNTLGSAFLSWFETIAAGDIVPAKKPAPDIFHYCLNHLAMTAQDCIAIEDSENGLKASLGANIPTIITVNTYTQAEDFTGALSVVNHLGDTGQPCQSLAGMPISSNMIDVDMLRALHAQAN